MSQVGREILIKAVAQAVPTYPMNGFCLPNRLCKDIDAAVAKFCWANSDQACGMHWINWDDLGLAKDDDGMGFRNIKDFNLALLAKLYWCLIHEPDSLWARVLKGRNFPNSSFLEARKGGCASWIWFSQLDGRELISSGAHSQFFLAIRLDFGWINGSLAFPMGTLQLSLE